MRNIHDSKVVQPLKSETSEQLTWLLCCRLHEVLETILCIVSEYYGRSLRKVYQRRLFDCVTQEWRDANMQGN